MANPSLIDIQNLCTQEIFSAHATKALFLLERLERSLKTCHKIFQKRVGGAIIKAGAIIRSNVFFNHLTVHVLFSKEKGTKKNPNSIQLYSLVSFGWNFIHTNEPLF